MRQNYADGGPGVIVSGLVWLITAAVIYMRGDWPGMITLFFGGMAIYPVSLLISNRMKAKDIDPPDKRLTHLALLTLPLLFGGIYAGYVLSSSRTLLFFTIIAMAIGIRYIIFETFLYT